ncbi:TetR/AcrR family transcriptional regulator [Streptomyces sp. ISL-22]|uniref:TetR/AcrR family transcriptional regulator n=1 Tax=unclassified Streptomyces TaxID=2593676 RepID=UPI001BE7F854|nr:MULTISPECIES: TetR/AcrR family transcriptional regulator [unclassified Streptomyces]MBT2420734.1 TetR/AcrR family transcriptional regulator [Streptomyces sp. ISL-24]MBT2437636.1 TetR/AcrR family transcriptional regulator [Streptomyces sp. ISL-22]
MPRTADHAQRRSQITEGLIRVAARDGVHAVTMRAVAAEAGVSLRLVQYYFETKGRLMLAALRHLEQQSHDRWAARLSALPDPPSQRARVEALLTEALPTDEASRTFHILWTSCAMLAMTDPDLAAQPFAEGPDRLEAQLADLLRQAQAEGGLAEAADPDVEATRLLALSHGLGTSVLVGRRTPDAAMEALGYHLDWLFSPPGSR